jgi:hypothetical protein
MKKEKKHPDIHALVQAINDNPDMLHLDYTPSVHQLSEYGLEAVQAILPLLNSKDEWERRRAERVLEGVIYRLNGWKPGVGFPDNSNGEQKVGELLQLNGNYQANASEETRQSSINKWELWLEKNYTQNGKR